MDVKLIALDDVAEAERKINAALAEGYELLDNAYPPRAPLQSGDVSVVMLTRWEYQEIEQGQPGPRRVQ